MIERDSTDTIVIHCSATPSNMDIGVDKIRKWHVDETAGMTLVIIMLSVEMEH